MYQTLNHNPSRVGTILCLSYQLYRYSKITHQLQVTYTKKLTLEIEVIYWSHGTYITTIPIPSQSTEVCFDITDQLYFVRFIALHRIPENWDISRITWFARTPRSLHASEPPKLLWLDWVDSANNPQKKSFNLERKPRVRTFLFALYSASQSFMNTHRIDAARLLQKKKPLQQCLANNKLSALGFVRPAVELCVSSLFKVFDVCLH